jgi:glycosyltransferase involved in cell wall biosynthesis
MKINPNITVLMPAYNAEKYIGNAIESVLAQTYSDFELVIINDGSTDGTQSIIETFNDERIVLVNQANMGVAGALNAGLKISNAPFIARFDADDICYPTRLEKQLNFLQQNPDYILVGSDVDYILENGEFLFHSHCIAHSHNEIMDKLYFYCPFFHPSVMYKKESVCNAGGYPADAHNFEDYLLWVAIAKMGKFCNLAEPLIKYRLNSTSITIDEKWRGKRFRKLKRSAIKRGSVTESEGIELLEIIKNQDVRKIKEGSYHALCGKKFLANNYQPQKARAHVKMAISLHPLRLDNYLLYTVSYFPEKFIHWLYKISPNRL